MKKILIITIGLFVINSTYAKSLKEFTLPIFSKKESFSFPKSAKGKKLLINFWASWCTACIKEIKELEALKIKYPKTLYIAINAGDTKIKIKRFLKKYKFSYLILEDKNSLFSKSIGVLELPRTLVVDTNKKIVYDSNKPPKEI